MDRSLGRGFRGQSSKLRGRQSVPRPGRAPPELCVKRHDEKRATRQIEGMKSHPLAPFLVFEGLDGSGKSTLIENLSVYLKKHGLDFRLTREPGGTPLAEDIRQLLLRTGSEAPVATTELLLYAASRAQHVAKVILPSLERGEWILCDRFTASSVAFQCFARGLSRSDTNWLNEFAIQGVKPSLTILLDLSVEESAARQIHREKKDRMENESKPFHEAVRAGYLAQARENPDSWLVLDARLSKEELQTKLVENLEKRGWLGSTTN